MMLNRKLYELSDHKLWDAAKLQDVGKEASMESVQNRKSQSFVVTERGGACNHVRGVRAGGLAAMGALIMSGCGVSEDEAGPATHNITYRQFSSAPSLGHGGGSVDPHDEDYGALSFFINGGVSRTAALGQERKVGFSSSAGAVTLADVANNTYQAAYLPGSSLNSVWGFVYNSGVPFGPTFSGMVDFLYDGDGIRLANQILANRNVDVVAFPVVGSPAQVAGYFKKPIGTPECPEEGDEDCRRYQDGIGLEGLCSEPWTLRYLPPAETVIDLACDDFDGPQRLNFVQAIPGGSDLLTAIQQGIIDGLEFATPLDDFDAARGGLFANASAPVDSDGRNVGEIGLRFAHHPAWHQPFFLGWMIINRSQVWENLDRTQQAAINEAAQEAVIQSFNASSSVQCDFLQRILDINDGREQRDGGPGSEISGLSAEMILSRWEADDLSRLRDSTRRFLENTTGDTFPTDDEIDYATVITALHEHLGYSSIGKMLDAWTEPGFPVPSGCTR